MGKPTPRKLGRKRRQARQRVKAERRAEQKRPRAYHGQKYQTLEFVEPTFRTELAIYTAFVSSGRALCDDDVRRALERLIADLRLGRTQSGQPASHDPVACSVRSSWEEWADCPAADDLVGVLRTILGSLEVWSSPRANSRGYLSYLEGFMKKAGASCQATAPVEPDPPGESGLLAIGRAWSAGEEGAGAVFRALAEQMLADGQSDEVAETCQQLIGEGTSTGVFRQLSMLAIDARRGFLRQVS